MKPEFHDGEGGGPDFPLSPDTMLRLVCSMLLASLLFGAGLVLALTIPGLEVHARQTIPLVIWASLVLPWPLSRPVAWRMRLRNWGRRGWVKGDFLSG